jgi:abortive infection bacteriophage resistance protein
MQPYTKTHLSLQDQVKHLQGKGLDCAPLPDALMALHDFGYYRLAAYTYPFRRLLKDGEPRDTPFQYRADTYLPGAKLAEAVALAKFDHGLRDKTFEGIAALELALRFQIAHVLGARNKFGHTDRSALDRNACAALAPYAVRSAYPSMFDYWIAEYDKLIRRAKSEDYIRHIEAKYSSEIPIWIAVEAFDFGGLVRLYSLLERYDQNLIAKRFGISDGRLFHQWLVGIGVLRNHCAHHNRLWNRQFPMALAGVPNQIVGQSIHHLSQVTARKKFYAWAAVLAYSLRTYDDTSNWFRTFTTQMRKFPATNGVTLVGDMGFPPSWETQTLWSGAPASSRSIPTPTS